MRNSAKPNVVGHSFFPLFAVVGLIAGLAGAMMYWPEIGEVETSKVELVEIETVEFAADFSEAEKQMILEILRDNELPDLGVLGRIKLVKTQPPEPVAEANNDGVVRIRADVLAAASYGQLRDIVGHELGHLFDTYFLLDEDRLEYARLRGIKKPGLLDKWYLDPNAHNYAKSELHSVTPAEDLAEVFRQVYFPGSDVGISTDYGGEVSGDLEAWMREQMDVALARKFEFLEYGVTPAAARAWEEMESGAEQFPRMVVPDEYGPLALTSEYAQYADELVYTAYHQTDPYAYLRFFHRTSGYGAVNRLTIASYAGQRLSRGGVEYMVLELPRAAGVSDWIVANDEFAIGGSGGGVGVDELVGLLEGVEWVE